MYWTQHDSNGTSFYIYLDINSVFLNHVFNISESRCICTEFISKNIQQSEFRSVKQSRMYYDSIQDCNIDLST